MTMWQHDANIGGGSKPAQEEIATAPLQMLGETDEKPAEEIAPSKPDQEPDPHAAERCKLGGVIVDADVVD